MEYHLSKLTAKVTAQNKVNKEINRIYPLIVAALLPFKGKKVNKTNGDFLESIKLNLEGILNTKDFRAWRHNSTYSLSWGVSASEQIDGDRSGCIYAESYVRVGGIQDQVLTELNTEFNEYKTDYKVEEIREARAKLRAAKDLVSDCEAACQPFGEFDN